jgi:DNA-binding CsgD family transcriptional regulator
LLVAAASDTDELGPIVDALARLELGRRLLETAEDEGLVRIDGGRLEFRHPLVRSAVYYGAAASERRHAHRVLAEALEGVDEQRRAWHAAAAAFGPDEDAARLLEAAGTRSRDRGAYASAAAAFERAVRLGDSARRGARLVLAADAAWLAGDPSSATRLVAEGLEDDAAAEVLGELIALRARIELHCGSQERAFRWFVDAADLVEPTRPDRAAEMLADAISAGFQSAGPELQDVARRLERLPDADDPMVELLLAQASAVAASATGTSKGVVALGGTIEAALDDRGTALQPPLHLYWVSRGYWMLGRNRDASSLASEGVRRTRDGEASGLLPQLLRVLALADYDRGDWRSARAAAAEAAELAEELGQTTTQSGCLALLAELEAAVGDEAACRQHVRRAVEISRPLGLDFHRERAERALGRLELALGKLDLAAVQLEAVAERLARSGNREFNVTPLADLVEVCARRSALPEAESALARLEALALDLMIGEEAILARCRGIVADEHSFASDFAEALELHRSDPFPFERARTELCFGERLRRSGERRAARQQLQAAAATFEELGAVAWTSRAHDELRASGARLRRADAEGRDFLTPREAQIAEQVAQGKANREVAAALYLTSKTVEFHLTRIYRKLGVRSRSELVRKLGR